ncbi:WD repeat-containing protein 13-like, partial [Pyrgilauda ruficollis]|uniref:WD repeat-containing protein 13-like n=1 Tax=Pyrgilauda ruficollis TaxID=221976 RepID=UPI001B863908
PHPHFLGFPPLSLDPHPQYTPQLPQFRTQYVRRRSQLLRERAQGGHLAGEARRWYLRLRARLLAQRYGALSEAGSCRSALRASRTTLDRMEVPGCGSAEGAVCPPGPPAVLRRLRGHGAGVSDFAWSLSNDVLVSASLDGTLRLWDPADGRCIRRVPDPDGAALLCCAFQPLNNNLTVCFGGFLTLYNFGEGSHPPPSPPPVRKVQFAHDERHLLACCSLDGTLSVCRLAPGPPAVLRRLRGHGAGVSDFAWSLSNDVLVSASLDGTLRLWDPADGRCIRRVPDPDGAALLCCAFQPLNNNLTVVRETPKLA